MILREFWPAIISTAAKCSCVRSICLFAMLAWIYSLPAQLIILSAIVYFNVVTTSHCFTFGSAAFVNCKEQPNQQTAKYFEVVELTGIEIYPASGKSYAEICLSPVGSVLEIVEQKDSCEGIGRGVITWRGRLADGRGWITISRGDKVYAHECMRPYASGAAVISGAIISDAALR